MARSTWSKQFAQTQGCVMRQAVFAHVSQDLLEACAKKVSFRDDNKTNGETSRDVSPAHLPFRPNVCRIGWFIPSVVLVLFIAVACPNKCSSRGTCKSMLELSLWDGFGLAYSNWEASVAFGCACDPHYGGPDCSLGAYISLLQGNSSKNVRK